MKTNDACICPVCGGKLYVDDSYLEDCSDYFDLCLVCHDCKSFWSSYVLYDDYINGIDKCVMETLSNPQEWYLSKRPRQSTSHNG